MSSVIINGKQDINGKEDVIGKEVLQHKPVTSKNLFSENNAKESGFRKLIIKKKHINILNEIPSDLGKRNLADSFGIEIYNDKERYGQDIPTDFFKTNIGHLVYEDPLLNEAEILDWCYKYLASKKIQI
jgi:hypothetical protein